MLTLVQLIPWDTANPSQWSGKTDEGRDVYIRYRWGVLSVEDENTQKSLAKLCHGGKYSGTMDTETMLKLTGIEVREE
jgi:hypothetical protein